MGVLQEVMRYKERKEAQEAQVANAIPQAVQAFIQGRQQQQKNMIDMLQIDAGLAAKGLRRTANGFERDTSLESPIEQFIQSGQVADASLKMAQAGVGGLPGGRSFSGGMIGNGGQLNVPQGGATQPIQAQPTAQAEDNDLFYTKTNLMGVPTEWLSEEGLRRQKEIASQEKRLDEQTKQGAKQDAAARNVTRSAEAVTSAMGRLAEGWVEAYEEGGVGNILAEKVSDIATRVGGDVGDKYRKTSALPGLKTEIVARMMPILTQQGEKEGSVRLVESVFRKLEETLPKKFSGPGAARDQMAATINNMYGFTKAFYDLGVKAEDVEKMSESEFSSYMSSLEKARERVVSSEEETGAIKEITSSVLKPLDEVIQRKGSSNFKVGDERNRGGVTYVRQKDGTWKPKKS